MINYIENINKNENFDIVKLIALNSFFLAISFNRKVVINNIKSQIDFLSDNANRNTIFGVTSKYLLAAAALNELDELMKSTNSVYGAKKLKETEISNNIRVISFIYNSIKVVNFIDRKFKRKVSKEQKTILSKSINNVFKDKLNDKVLADLLDSVEKFEAQFKKKYNVIKYHKIEEIIVMVALEFSKKYTKDCVISFFEWAVEKYCDKRKPNKIILKKIESLRKKSSNEFGSLIADLNSNNLFLTTYILNIETNEKLKKHTNEYMNNLIKVANLSSNDLNELKLEIEKKKKEEAKMKEDF